MAQISSEYDDLCEEIELHKGFIRSLEGERDSQAERDRIQQELQNLESRLDKMRPLPQWGQSADNQSLGLESRHPGYSAASSHSHLSQPSTSQSSNALPDTQHHTTRKRDRLDDDLELPLAKSHRSTPQPRSLSRDGSVDSFDFFDDFSLKDILGDNWREQEKKTKDYLTSLEAKKIQEQEDAAFARQLQETWAQDQNIKTPAPQVFTPPSMASSSSSYLNQSYLKPNGSWQKPTAQPIPSRLKTEYKTEVPSPGTITPLTDSSSGLEEIPPQEWNRSFNPGFKPSSVGHYQDKPSFPSSMPGGFPSIQSSPYTHAAGSLVYGNPYNPYASRPTGGLFNGVSGSSTPGSFDSPFDLESMPSPRTMPYLDEYADPVQTQEEIKDLLKHIRPDEELTEEQQREVQPEGLRIDLMPHQRKGFAWLKSMEEGTNKGGILADDMGLGKTVQALALILGRPPAADARTPTLVVAPVALMQQWEREIKKFVKPSHALKVLILHQENRNKPWNFIRDYDVVLTTYGTLASDLKRKIIWDKHLLSNPGARPRPQQLCPVLGDTSRFHRVILDEAQNIKNKSTKGAAAACKINAKYRWCLSGTPMQNNVDEIYSLIKFCRIRPYHDYEKFARDIGRPLKRTSDWGKEKAMKQLQAILKAILLRRTKESKIDGQPIIQLPEKRTVEDLAIFSKDELDFYKQLEQQAQIQFNRFLKQGTVGRYYSHALVLLLRLRQCCCSPQLVTNAKEFLTSGPLGAVDHINNAKNLSEEVVQRLDANDAFECPICFDAVENPIIFVPCGHTLCNECLQAMVDKSMTDAQAALNCPHCRAVVDINKVTDLESYLRVHHPDRPGVKPLDGYDDDSGSDTVSDSSDDEAEDDDDGQDLRGFIVPDDHVDSDNDADEDNDEKVEPKSEAEADPDETKLSRAKPAADKKLKKDKKRRSVKGKAKAKNKHISLADLRKEGLKSKAAKKRYLKRLEKGFETSAKIEKTLEILHEIRDRGLGEKTIIFSSFTSFLDLLEVPLHKDEELSNYVRFDGSMKAVDRNNAVIRFSDDPHCKVMLVSLKAGNSGLNLTAANHVILLDPFWNPFVEYQAADRCYRIGQQREVTIHRVLIGESEEPNAQPDVERDFTVEDRILRLQDKKRKLVETALDEKAATSLGRLTTQDLGFLFGVNAMS